MKKIAMISVMVLASLLMNQAFAVTVNFKWPEELQGSYRINGMWQKSEDYSYDFKDGWYRLLAPGLDTNFGVKGGKVSFQPPADIGVTFDAETNTISFQPVTFSVEMNDYDMPVQVSSCTKWFTREQGEAQKITTIYSYRHALKTWSGESRIVIDAQNKVSLPEEPPGVSVKDTVVSLHPQPFTFIPGGNGTWELSGSVIGRQNSQATLNLIPNFGGNHYGVYSYEIRIWPDGAESVQQKFWIDRDFKLSTTYGGPFSNVILIDLPGVDAQFAIARGGVDFAKWKADREQEQAQAKLVSAKLSAAVQKASWHKDFELKDYLQIYDFPEELISYPLEFPDQTVKQADLLLMEKQDELLQPVDFQLSDIEQQNGWLQKATISFRSSLPRASERSYILISSNLALQPKTEGVQVLEKNATEAVFGSNLLHVKVPYGARRLYEGKPLTDTPAPIIAVSRAGAFDTWVGQGSFVAPEPVKVLGVDAGPIVEGPLFGKYRVKYTFDGGRKYTAVIGLRHNEKYLTIDEYMEGFGEDSQMCLKFDFVPNFNPDRRQVMNNGGYLQYSGAIDKGAKGFLPFGTGEEIKGKLPYELGLNTPNSYGIMRATSFYEDHGQNALLLALYRIREWKQPRRMVWYDTWGGCNLRFFSYSNQKYMLATLTGKERHWAMSLIPRTELVHDSKSGDGKHLAGPEVRLWQKLTDFSLDSVKDMVFEWNETTERRLSTIGSKISYAEWHQRHGFPAPFWFLRAIVDVYWDFSGTVGPVSFRAMPGWYGDYDASRADWTLDQRKHVRALLVWMANSCEDDNNLPHHSMLSGHPNFIMDVKQTLALACAVLPNHPSAPKWRASFQKYFDEWLDVYQRDDDPEHNAIGGRWTENIACYSGTALRATLHSYEALKSYDGSNLLDHPKVRAWINWYLNAMMSPHYNVRYVPPEGAHSRAFEPKNGHGYLGDMFEIAHLLHSTAPELSDNMRWVQTNGREGKKPDLESVLIADHGPFMRYDFGGPHEAYLHLTQIAGDWNYRWGGGNSVLYYGAKQRIWSYNTMEAAGDRWNLNDVTSFTVDGRGLGRHPTDQPLYDFDFAQFYYAVGTSDQYHGRAIFMMRDDYIALYDDVEGDAEGQFVWASVFEMPAIHQIMPNAPVEEDIRTGPSPREGADPPRIANIRRYKGKGDFLTVVAPAGIQTAAAPYGAVVGRDEYIFAKDEPMKFQQKNIEFEGQYGYARENQLAIFEGSSIRLSELSLKIEGKFGASADATEAGKITGRFAGTQGGRLFVKVTDPENAQSVSVDGTVVQFAVEDGWIVFDAPVSQRDGYKSYVISFKE